MGKVEQLLKLAKKPLFQQRLLSTVVCGISSNRVSAFLQNVGSRQGNPLFNSRALGSKPDSQKADRSVIYQGWKGCEKSEEEASEYLAHLNSEEATILKFLKVEYESLYCSCMRVPRKVTNVMWLEHLENYQVSSPPQRLRAWDSFFRGEIREQKKEKKSPCPPVKKEEWGPAHYLMLFIARQNQAQHREAAFYRAMANGPHIVIDCGFENIMTEREMKSLALQLSYIHSSNKALESPFHLHFCNFNPKTFLAKFLKENCNADEWPYTFSQEDYVDLYPKSQLVMLSPNGRQPLKNVDLDKVYILGGIVDKARQDPVTFTIAKRKQIECLRLPLENVRYILTYFSLETIRVGEYCK